MIKLDAGLRIIESKEDFLEKYNKNLNIFNYSAFEGFNEKSNFPIMIRYVEPFDNHWMGTYYLVTDKEEIKKIFDKRKKFLEKELKILDKIEKVMYNNNRK